MEMTTIVHPRAYQILQGMIKLPQERRGGPEDKLLEQQFKNLLQEMEEESRKYNSTFVVKNLTIQKPSNL